MTKKSTKISSKNHSETSSYVPPQSPISIQPGDKGFITVGKAYNRFIWNFKDWEKRKKKDNKSKSELGIKFQTND